MRAAAVAGWRVAVAGGAPTEVGLSLLLAAFLAWVGRPLRRAHAEPVPGRIGPAVGACVLGLVILDAAFAAATGPGWSLAALAFLGPAVGLSKVFDVS